MIDALKVLEVPAFNLSFLGYSDFYKAVKLKGFDIVLEGHGPDELLGGYSIFYIMLLYNSLRRLDFSSARILRRRIRFFFPTNYRHLLRSTLAFSCLRLFSSVNIRHEVDAYFDTLSMPINLRVFDRMTMLQQVESRSPFLDYRIVEYLKSLPTSSYFVMAF